MKVTVVDRATMDQAWGQPGPYQVITRSVHISDYCRICGKLRGRPQKRTFFEDGITYMVDCWQNKCGHIDRYKDVLQEARDIRGGEIR